MLCTAQGLVQTFSLAARPHIIVEARINQRNEIVVQQSVQHAVAHRGYGDVAAFLFIHNAVVVATMIVLTSMQIGAEPQ